MYKFCPNCGYSVKNLISWGFKCQHCQKHIYLNSKPAVSVIPVFENQVLLSIRGVEPMKGMVDVIGGFLDQGEDPLDGAVREFYEETKHKLDQSQLIFIDTVVDKYPFEGEVYWVLVLNYLIKFDRKLKLVPGDDVASLKWSHLTTRHRFSFRDLQKTIDKIPSLLNPSSSK